MQKIAKPNLIKILFCSVASIGAAFTAVLLVVYFVGRTLIWIGPVINGAKFVGLIFCVLCFMILLRLFKIKEMGLQLTFTFLNCGFLLLILQNMPPNAYLGAYAMGFKDAVFAAAPESQWVDLPRVIAKKIDDPSIDAKYKFSIQDLYPDYVWKVYPQSHFAEGKSPGVVETNIVSVWLEWRGGWGYSPAIEIGPTGKYGHAFDRPIYTNRFSGSITFVLVGGND
jgi:hypothetical protein